MDLSLIQVLIMMVSLTNVHFYVENYTLKVSYKVKISIGGASSTSSTQYLTLKNNVH